MVHYVISWRVLSIGRPLLSHSCSVSMAAHIISAGICVELSPAQSAWWSPSPAAVWLPQQTHARTHWRDNRLQECREPFWVCTVCEYLIGTLFDECGWSSVLCRVEWIFLPKVSWHFAKGYYYSSAWLENKSIGWTFCNYAELKCMQIRNANFDINYLSVCDFRPEFYINENLKLPPTPNDTNELQCAVWLLSPVTNMLVIGVFLPPILL